MSVCERIMNIWCEIALIFYVKILLKYVNTILRSTKCMAHVNTHIECVCVFNHDDSDMNLSHIRLVCVYSIYLPAPNRNLIIQWMI